MAETASFARKSSGLIRAWSPWDAFVYNFFAPCLPAAYGLFYMLYPTVFSGGNPFLSAVMVTILALFLMLTYMSLAVTLPRDAGDYVFQSRVLHPAIGYSVPFVQMFIMQMFWIGPVAGMLTSQVFLAPGLFTWGVYSGSKGLIDLAAFLSSTWGIFLGAIIYIVWESVICIVGMKWYALAQKVCFVLTVINIVMIFYVIAGTTRQGFISAYDSFALQYAGMSNAYQQTIAGAAGNPIEPIFNNTYLTFTGMTVASWGIFFTQLSATTCLGEIRKSESIRVQLISMVLSLVVFSVPFLLLIPTLYNMLGYEFSAAIGFVQGTAYYPFPIVPYFNFFIHILIGNNAALQALFLITWNGWWWAAYINGMLQASRISVVYSLDRVLPEWMGKVNERFHTPHWGILVGGLLAFIYSVAWVIFPWFSELTWATIFCSMILFFFSSLAAILLPYRRKDLYEMSPISKYKIGGAPFIVVVGLITFIMSAWMIYAFAVTPALGTQSTVSLTYIIGMYILAVIIFYAMKAYRKKQGIDISTIYQYIPPE